MAGHRHVFLSGGGEMGALMRAHDWSATSLGAPDGWPQPLQTAVGIVLGSPLLGAIFWGPNLLFFYNDAYAPALLDRHPAALGRPVREVWSDIWADLGGPFLHVLNGGEGFAQQRFPLKMRRNGVLEDTFWNFSISPIRDAEGRTVGLLNQAFEITAQVRAEHYQLVAETQLRAINAELRRDMLDQTEVLGRSERRAAAYFNFSEDQLCLVWSGPDEVLRFEDINPAAERAFGLVRTTIAGLPVDDLLPAGMVADVHRHTRHCLESRQPQRYQAACVLDTGARVLDVRITFVERFADGHGLVLLSGHDVTDQLAIEEQLRQSQKMEAVGQLTGGLAHDFNNLLAGISGSLELMTARISQGRVREIEKYLIAAQGATKRAAALTHRLLAFSRRQTLSPKAISVNAMVTGMLDLVRRTVGPSVQVDSVLMAGLWVALVDQSQLENALLNLCINARDAMPDGGRITIETSNRWIDRHGAKQHDMPEGQYLALCVSDTGTGMPPDVIAKAFDPFFTTKPMGQGTGLGLSMIYGFARQSGGHTRIYSEVGQGTMVCLYLPRHRGTADQDDATADASALAMAEAGETVLIVDDEPTVRMLVVDVLNDLGYTAIEASDGAAGLKILQSDTRIDLLVTDVGLPGLNGRQMVDAARSTRPDLRVLFITGFAENALLNNGQLEPGMSVLTKPFAVDTLASRMREMIAK